MKQSIETRLSTRDISIEEFNQVHEQLNPSMNYRRAASDEIRIMLVKDVLKRFAIEQIKFQGIGAYSKINIERVDNDPSMDGFDKSKPIWANFTVVQNFELA